MTTNLALATTTLPHPDVADGSPPQPVGAENRVTGSDSILPRASPQGHVPNQPSMIARRGPRTCLPDARSRAELAGATRPLRHRQGRRDPHAATRSRGAAPHQPTTNLHLARPRRTQRIEQTASGPAAAAATGVTPNAAALARPARRPPLDLPAPTTRPTTHRTPRPGLWCCGWPARIPAGATDEFTACVIRQAEQQRFRAYRGAARSNWAAALAARMGPVSNTSSGRPEREPAR
jgi:hypothetical protein